ncbi:MAG TPA: terminase small subunit [Pyrinomonadaceae bacterium]|jgi:hypothetical protein
MPAGRPIEYSEEILEKAQEYLDLCIDEEFDWTKTNGDKSTSYEHRIKVKLPSIEGLAVYLKVARSTIYEWEKIYPEFSDILEDIKAEQAQRLINNGLSGDYNPTISKLILTKHGYSDKSETDLTSGGKPFPILMNIPSVPNNDSDQQNSEADQENQGSTGRDISQQDNLDTPLIDSLQPDGQEA